jgi:hypothetical protein
MTPTRRSEPSKEREHAEGEEEQGDRQSRRRVDVRTRGPNAVGLRRLPQICGSDVDLEIHRDGALHLVGHGDRDDVRADREHMRKLALGGEEPDRRRT